MGKKMEKQIRPAKTGVMRLGFVGEKKPEKKKVPKWMNDHNLIPVKSPYTKDDQLAKVG